MSSYLFTDAGLFDHDLQEQFSAIEKTGEPPSLIMIDVDRFGLLNKTYGHPVGDDVLKFVANTIREITGSKGKCYRYGGEEIAIILPNYTAEEAAALAERARHQTCAAALGEQQSIHVSVSFGVAQIPMHASTASELLKLADSALLDAKTVAVT